jgi:hypothetical protein
MAIQDDEEQPDPLPLGVGAYDRTFGKMPEVRLINRFFEENPTNQVDNVALLSRPGTTRLDAFGGGKIRKLFAQEGTFSGDLFVVSGGALFRYSKDGVKTQVNGTVLGTATPSIAGTRQFLFIADGTLLQFYDGVGSRAKATLTVTGAVAALETVTLQGTTYTFRSSLVGSVANDVFLGANTTEALQNLADAVNKVPETSGVAYNASTVKNAFIAAAYSPLSPTPPNVTLEFTALNGGVIGNSYATTDTMATGSFGGATMSGGAANALSGITTPDDVAIVSLAVLGGFVLCLVSNSQRIYFIRPGEFQIDPLDFFESESLPDDGISLRTVGDQVWCFNKQSTDAFYLSGDGDAPFSQFQGRSFSIGALPGTDVLLDPEVVVVGNDGIVYAVGGGGQRRISTHGIEERIRKARKAERTA